MSDSKAKSKKPTMSDLLRVLSVCFEMHIESQAKRIDGEFVVRWTWKVTLVLETNDLVLNGKELESKWEGFATEAGCIANMCSCVSTWIRSNAKVKVKKQKVKS